MSQKFNSEKSFPGAMKFELSQLTAYHHLLFRSLIGNFSQERKYIFFSNVSENSSATPMINECNTNIFEIYLHSYQNSSYEHPCRGGTPGVDCFSIFRDSSHVNWQFNKFSALYRVPYSDWANILILLISWEPFDN